MTRRNPPANPLRSTQMYHTILGVQDSCSLATKQKQSVSCPEHVEVGHLHGEESRRTPDRSLPHSQVRAVCLRWVHGKKLSACHRSPLSTVSRTLAVSLLSLPQQRYRQCEAMLATHESCAAIEGRGNLVSFLPINSTSNRH